MRRELFWCNARLFSLVQKLQHCLGALRLLKISRIFVCRRKILAFTSVAAISVSVVLNSIGLNTHLDSYKYGYQNLPATEAAINYLGVKNLRDSAQHPWSLNLWQQVADATGARFDDYMGRGSPAQDRA